MKIVHVSAECYPWAKVGGLADVVGALPKYLTKKNVASLVIIPFYKTNYIQGSDLTIIHEFTIQVGKTNYDVQILSETDPRGEITINFIKIPTLLDRENIYGSADDTKRFIAFQIAALQFIKKTAVNPDIIHCHDHHTGFIPFMMSHCTSFDIFKSIPTVFSIHNAQYQGAFSHDQLFLLPTFDLERIGLLDWYGNLNPMAAAIKCAWRVTTVSSSYLKELQLKANGLEGLLAHENKKCVGILNGIDPIVWNPNTDPFIVKNYNAKSAKAGKKSNKDWICKTYKFDPKKPLFAFIGRFVYEKSADLLPEVIKTILSKRDDLSILILGSGNDQIEKNLRALENQYVGNYNNFIGYDEKLSHIIYAGSDFLLMPSRVEPCGLNQMYSQRYGTIPIVRETGGLMDTVVDIGDDGFGFTHKNANVQDIIYSIERALAFYNEAEKFKKTQLNNMKIDNSWDNSAHEYVQLYKTLINHL